MEGIQERIQEIRNKLSISLPDFAKRIFIRESLLRDIEQGKRSIDDRTIQLISTEFDVNKEWLLTGKGMIFSAPQPDTQLEKLIEKYDQLNKDLQDYLIEQSNALLKSKKKNHY